MDCNNFKIIKVILYDNEILSENKILEFFEWLLYIYIATATRVRLRASFTYYLKYAGNLIS